MISTEISVTTSTTPGMVLFCNDSKISLVCTQARADQNWERINYKYQLFYWCNFDQQHLKEGMLLDGQNRQAICNWSI